MTSLKLREAGLADAEEIALLHADSWRRHYRGAYSDSYLDGDVLADRRSVWSTRLAAPDHTATIVVDGDSGVVAFVHVLFDDDDRWGSLVDNLHVTLDRQRTGLGTALLVSAARAVIERATNNAMYLWVLEQNTSAQQFYSALGATNVESATVTGEPGRITGSPKKLRMTWPDASSLCG